MRKQQGFKWSELELGTCYYPEHWDRSMWREDLVRMLEAGIRTVRIGEFGWILMEPKEGVFCYEPFDSFLELAQEMGMKVIFGTPTATPPAWLTEKYPEVLNCRMDGVKYRHGMRRQYNYNSKVYREKAAIITEKMAAHYAKHPMVIGWQIDNELNCESDTFYSESDTLAFRAYLKAKYQDLDTLNKAWGTVVWSQIYTEWEEIFVPRTVIHETSQNPHLLLDYSRFVSESARSFCALQSEILRRYIKPGDFITTNGKFARLDNHAMTDESLDVYTYDSYPNFAYCLCEDPLHTRSLNDRMWSNHLTEVRSICPHFGIMEQQSGANGWHTRMEAPAPKPGQLALWAMQSIAHGADYVSFFRWRTATMGTEIYWHGILDYDNRDNRKLKEVREVYARTQAIRETVGAEYIAKAALVRDYDNMWDSTLDVWHKRLAWSSEDEIFIGAQLSHTPLDQLFLLEDTEVSELMKYPVLIYPHPLIMSEAKAALLTSYVEQGGILILGARSGQKDVNGQCNLMPMPGLLAGLTGTDVEEFTFIGPADEAQSMNWNDRPVETGVFADILHADAEDAKVLAVYEKDFYAGKPALIERRVGKGSVLHFGGTFTRENTEAFLAYTGVKTPMQEVIELPSCMELAVKEKDGKQYLFVLNYEKTPQKLCLKQPVCDLDTLRTLEGEVVLEPYGTRVYRL